MKQIQDKVMTFVIYGAGMSVLAIMGVLVWYLANESKFAVNQTFPYGYKFAATAPKPPADYAVEFDVNSTLLGSHFESSDGIDDNEASAVMPDMASMKGVSQFGTGTIVMDGSEKALSLVNRRLPQAAEKPAKFTLYAFATPEYTGDTMTIRWEPDAAFLPDLTPYNIHLKLVKAPKGVMVKPIDIDLKAQPKGSIEIPTYIAKNDAARTGGYVFQMAVTRGASTFGATITNMLKPEWAPTLQYPRFGILPLLYGTLLTTLLAIVISAPIAILLALYLSEFAPTKFREIAKPAIELLASVPTVVLAFFGLGVIAPGLQATIGQGLGMQSAHSMLTAAMTLAVLLIPTITTVAEDALRNLPVGLRDGAEALGLTLQESLRKVVLPAAKSGLIACILLGIARAVGETMILWMLNGSTPSLPKAASLGGFLHTLGGSSKGMPDTVGSEMANVVVESSHYGHLFVLGFILLIITLGLNLTGYAMARRAAWQH